MTPLPIAHIGILVADLETSRERWSRALGVFSPISRYRPENWSDLGDPTPHLHDARLTFFLGDEPSIEILEFVGTGTHSPAKGEGGHHLSFPPLDDNVARRAELEQLGIGHDGEIWHDGRLIFQFADAAALDNVYTEWVEEHPDHPDVKDDLSPIGRMPDGAKTLFEVDRMLALQGRRPSSGIVEIGIAVHDLDASLELWPAVTGHRFTRDGARAEGDGATTLILEEVAAGERTGVTSATIAVDDLAATRHRLRANGVPFAEVTSDRRAAVEVDPGFLNAFTVRFRG